MMNHHFFLKPFMSITMISTGTISTRSMVELLAAKVFPTGEQVG